MIAKDKTFLDYIRPELLHLLPVHLWLVEEMPMSETATRAAESDTYHTEGYVCGRFYKPISRCMPE